MAWACLGEGLIDLLLAALVGVGEESGCPALEVGGEVVAVDVDGQIHGSLDALEVLDGTSEVDASHGLDEDVETGTLVGGGEHEVLVAIAAVERADVLAVEEHLHVVVATCDVEFALSVSFGQEGAVHDGAPSLVELFHRLDLLGEDDLGQVLEEGSVLREPEGRHGDDGQRLGCCWQFLVAVLLQHGAQFVELGGSLSVLVDGCVVVVGGHVGRETG